MKYILVNLNLITDLDFLVLLMSNVNKLTEDNKTEWDSVMVLVKTEQILLMNLPYS